MSGLYQQSPLKRQKMSVTQTYYLAHTARAKLSTEAARPDHNLRLLVHHANLLDGLMVQLADAESEQESWFNQSVSKATKSEGSKSEEPRHIQWSDTIVEEPEEDWQAEDADSSDSDDSEYDEDEDIEMEAGLVSLQRVASNQISPIEYEDAEEDFADLGLHRTVSHSTQPPELDHDSDSSEDESMPPSPPSDTLPTFSEKQREQIATTSYYSKQQPSIPESEQQAFFDEGFYLPQRNSPSLISAISVY